MSKTRVSEYSKRYFVAVISHHDIVHCRARLDHSVTQSTATSSEDDKTIEKNLIPVVGKIKINN